MVLGPEAIAEAMSGANVTDSSGDVWQYHSRSDHHSKLACTVILSDLIAASSLLRRHAHDGMVAVGVNHEMRDFRSGRKKDLDFVVSRPTGALSTRSLADLAHRYRVPVVDGASDLREAPVGAVLVALEAKACMTAHIKALPRLFDELNSSQETIHGAAHEALAAAFVMINAGRAFVAPLTKVRMSHDQPRVTMRVLEKVRELPRRSRIDDHGYDALAVVLVDCANDGSPVMVVEEPPAPDASSIDNYARLIDRLAMLYASRFKEL